MDKDELKKLIINTYTTILAKRGIKGCYVCNVTTKSSELFEKIYCGCDYYTLK